MAPPQAPSSSTTITRPPLHTFLLSSALCFSLHLFPTSASPTHSSPPLFLPRTTPPMPPAQILLVNLILLSNHAQLPPQSTIFLPFNESLAVALPTPEIRDVVSYHITFPRLSFRDLLIIPGGSTIPTLLPNRRIVVSRGGGGWPSVSVDGLEIIAPDLYVDDSIVVHGIRRALDPNFYELQSSGATKLSPNSDF